MSLDPAVLYLLHLDPETTSVADHDCGGMSSANKRKITSRLPDGTSVAYFMKASRGIYAPTMFEGEHASLNAIHNIVPSLCPKSFGHGHYAGRPLMRFLVTEFLELTTRSSGRNRRDGQMTLAEKLAKLHTTPAPTPQGYQQPQFGFPVRTACGDTLQDNTFSSSWADFFANHRLLFILREKERRGGVEHVLSRLVEQTCTQVVPRLIGDTHLNHGRGVTPVIVHGDLWSGNSSAGKRPGMTENEPLVFDPSACYAHSEYELGIMKMFGGFGAGFLEEYHRLVPKTEPVDEYEDRVKLYELYHHLNHYALFGGSYDTGAMTIMRNLIAKYGEPKEPNGV